MKVNTLLLRGVNDAEACDLLEFRLERGYELRFIEQMPLDPMDVWNREQMVTAEEILDRLGTRWLLTPDPVDRARSLISTPPAKSDRFSGRVSAGDQEDTSGPVGVELLEKAGFVVSLQVVPDDAAAIRNAIKSAVRDNTDLVITTGGTGLGPRDVTPEVTAESFERPAPGLVELVRRSGSVPTAVLSRGTAGTAGRTLVINLAGSTGAAREGIAALLSLLPHAVDQLRGGDHLRPGDTRPAQRRAAVTGQVSCSGRRVDGRWRRSIAAVLLLSAISRSWSPSRRTTVARHCAPPPS